MFLFLFGCSIEAHGMSIFPLRIGSSLMKAQVMTIGLVFLSKPFDQLWQDVTVAKIGVSTRGNIEISM
jgi:hypothetical protein